MPELPAQSLAEHHTVLVQDVVQAAHQAMLERDWDALRLILHPYLHWTAADGSRLRGRIKIWIGCRTQRRRLSPSLWSCAMARSTAGRAA